MCAHSPPAELEEARLAAEEARREGLRLAAEAERVILEAKEDVAKERAEAATAKEEAIRDIEASRAELRVARQSEQRLREMLLQQGAELAYALSEEVTSRAAKDEAIRAKQGIELELLDSRQEHSSLRGKLHEANVRVANAFATQSQEQDFTLQQLHRARQALAPAQAEVEAEAASKRQIWAAHQKAKQALAKQKYEAEEKKKSTEQETKKMAAEQKEKIAALRQTNARLEAKLKKIRGVSQEKSHEASTARKALEIMTEEFISHEAESASVHQGTRQAQRGSRVAARF